MKTGYFIAQGRKRINPVLIAAAMLALSGCSHPEEKQFTLAPPPPVFDPYSTAAVAEPPRLMAFTGQPIPFPSHIALSGPVMSSSQSQFLTAGQRAALRTEDTGGRKCRIKDRFDRESVLAYQWGDNRLGLNVKGLSVRDQEIEGVKVEYKMRLQTYKSPKEKCRYDSHWQGLIGSGYNEMFLREKNTVWEQVEKTFDDVEDAFDKSF